MSDPSMVPLDSREHPPAEMRARAAAFLAECRRRRTVREFSDRPVDRAVVEDCLAADGQKQKNYYVSESVGIATGVLIAALNHAGLATLTHTPSPMGFLNQILGRPANERPFLLLVVGYPAPGAVVPAIGRKPLGEVVSYF